MTFATEMLKLQSQIKSGTISAKDFINQACDLVDKERDALTEAEKAAKFDAVMEQVKRYFGASEEAEFDGHTVCIDGDNRHHAFERIMKAVLGEDCYDGLNIFEEE